MESTKGFRMARLQLMNIINIGIANSISVREIEILANATINATQLFLTDYEILQLRKQLENRLQKYKIIV